MSRGYSVRTLKNLFDNNRRWVERTTAADPSFFVELSKQQSPEILWIGCSDRRVPASQIVDLPPGELFVHRNVANLVIPSDLNCLSVIQFAVDVLGVKHIIVCGHYGCGGVMAALTETPVGLVENWITHVMTVKNKHKTLLNGVESAAERAKLLCELNVIEQVLSVCGTTVVRSAWDSKQQLSIHGWIYDIADGLLNDLDICITHKEEINEVYDNCISRINPSR